MSRNEICQQADERVENGSACSAEEERIDMVAATILEKYRAAFEELAK